MDEENGKVDLVENLRWTNVSRDVTLRSIDSSDKSDRERRATVCREKHDDPRSLSRRARIYETPYACRLQMPEHVATRQAAVYSLRGGKGREMRVFFAEDESREFISRRKRNGPPNRRKFSYLFVVILISLPKLLEPLIRPFVGQEGINFPSMIQHIYRHTYICIYNMNERWHNLTFLTLVTLMRYVNM